MTSDGTRSGSGSDPTSHAESQEWIAILLKAEGQREWHKALKEIAKQRGTEGVIAALNAWKSSGKSGIPGENALLLHLSVAQHFAGRDDESAALLLRVLSKVQVGQDVATIRGFPALKFFAGGALGSLLSPEGRSALFADPPMDPSSFAGEDPYHFWGGSPGMGDTDAWKAYIASLSQRSKDTSSPVGALVASIWVHAIYMNNQRLFPGFMPPGSTEFVERCAQGVPAPQDGDPLAAILDAGTSRGDPEAVVLDEELRRRKDLQARKWTRHDAYGVWSLRVELARRFEHYQFPDDASPETRKQYEVLLDLAHQLVK